MGRVVHAESTNTSKARLDKCWSNQDIFMITVPKFKEPEAEVKLTSSCIVILLKFLSIEDAGKEAIHACTQWRINHEAMEARHSDSVQMFEVINLDNRTI